MVQHAPAVPAPRAAVPAAVQAKLEVGPANDHYERQADSVATAVMRASGPVAIPPTISPIGAQRQAAPGPKPREEKKKAAKASAGSKAQRKAALPPPKKEEPKKASSAKAAAQRKAAPTRTEEKKKPAAAPGKGGTAQREAAAGAEGGTASASADAAIQAMRSGPASRLDPSTQGFMESRFGRDFSGVRVHHGAKAAEAADSIGARAFTTGNDIFFNAGQYQPNSSGGRQLIAHELTHTVQQGGGTGVAARTRIQRVPTRPRSPAPPPAPPAAAPGAAPGAPPAASTGEATTAEPTVFPVANFRGAQISTVPEGNIKGEITLPVLALPRIAGALKGCAGGENAPGAADTRTVPVEGRRFTLNPPRPRRETTVAEDIWYAGARAGTLKEGVEARLTTLIGSNSTSIASTAGPVYYLTFAGSTGTRSEYMFSGTIPELANSDAMLKPQWSPQGAPLTGRANTLDADHFLEAQLGGADTPENMWLLQASYNRSVGPTIDNAITRDLNRVIAGAAAVPEDKRPSQPEVNAEWKISFATVDQGDFRRTTTYWTRASIETGRHINHLRVMDDGDLSRAGVRLRRGERLNAVRVYPSEAGGRRVEFPLDDSNNPRLPRFFYNGIKVISATYNGQGDLSANGGDLMNLEVEVFRYREGELISRRQGPVAVKRSSRLGLAGYISPDSIRDVSRGTTFRDMSPLSFDNLGISPDGELVGAGNVTATKALFPGLNVPLRLQGERIMMSFPIPQGRLDMGPLHVTETAISIGAGPDGVFLEGYAGFELGNLGTGSVIAEVSEAGPRLTGNFNLAMDFLNPASVTATYDFATDTLSAEATLGVQEGRIPGVESGQVTIGMTRDAVNVNGSLSLGGPLRGTTVNVTWNETDGLRIGADNIQLPLASVPAVQNATMSISAQKPPEGDWVFSGRGQATLVAPGATGTLAIEYQNGAFTVSGQGQVERGPASGTLDFTATNRQIDAEGNPLEGPPLDTLNVWGRGSVTVRFGNILTGTAGIEYTPDQRIILSGAIALPPTYELFPRRDYNRDLFTLAPPEFPIWGVSVAGVGVGVFAFVDARVAFNAYVGPGQIRNAQVGAVMDLDHPEDATITGHGEFYVPAYAGLTLDVGGGLRARAAVAYGEGRVGLTGALGVEASAGAEMDINWSREAGLAISADLHAEAQPKFELSANASITIGVDLLVTDVSHTFGPWRRQLGSFGPDMTLGVRMPVRWSEANGLDLSLDNIEVQRPSLDATELMSSVFDQLAG